MHCICNVFAAFHCRLKLVHSLHWLALQCSLCRKIAARSERGGLHVWYQLLHCLLQKSILVAYQHFFLGCISTLFSQKRHTFARILKNTELHWRKASIENWWYVDLQFRSNGLFCKKTRECWSRSLCVDSHSVTVTFYHTVVHCADNTPQQKRI